MLTTTPDPQHTVATLRDVTDVVWEALEYGISKTREFFEAEGGEVDAHFAAHQTRFHAVRFLEEHQQHAEYEREELANSGLRLRVDRAEFSYDIRIRKSDDGELPAPQSHAMREFYYQPVLEGFWDAPPVENVRLVVLWEAPRSYSHVAAMTIACPAIADGKRSVRAHWHVPVPHPSTTASVLTVAGSQMLEEEPITDLPVEALPAQQTGTDSEQE